MIHIKMRLVVGVLLIANLWVTTPLFGQDSVETHQVPEDKTTSRKLSPSEMMDFIAESKLKRDAAKKATENLATRNEFMRGLYRGIDQMQGTYHGAVGRGHSLLGNDIEAAKSFSDYEDEMRQASENPRLAPTFGSMIDDPFGWLAATAGEYALLTLFCTSIFAGVFFWISKQRSRHETERNSEKGIAMLDRKETFFWVRKFQDDKVVYTYRNYKIFYFCILPLLILFMGVPVIGLMPILGWIFYWVIYPRPNNEITQLLKEAQCATTGSKLSAVNPMRLTFSRTDNLDTELATLAVRIALAEIKAGTLSFAAFVERTASKIPAAMLEKTKPYMEMAWKVAHKRGMTSDPGGKFDNYLKEGDYGNQKESGADTNSAMEDGVGQHDGDGAAVGDAANEGGGAQGDAGQAGDSLLRDNDQATEGDGREASGGIGTDGNTDADQSEQGQPDSADSRRGSDAESVADQRAEAQAISSHNSA